MSDAGDNVVFGLVVQEVAALGNNVWDVVDSQHQGGEEVAALVNVWDVVDKRQHEILQAQRRVAATVAWQGDDAPLPRRYNKIRMLQSGDWFSRPPGVYLFREGEAAFPKNVGRSGQSSDIGSHRPVLPAERSVARGGGGEECRGVITRRRSPINDRLSHPLIKRRLIPG